MGACSISYRSLWLMMVLCLFGARGLGVAQSPTLAQTRIPGGGYRIAGTVVSKADGRPLARARVIVRNVKNLQSFLSVVTSEDGKFEFSGLPAGKYSLDGTKRGFIPAAYEQHEQFSTAIVTGAGLDTETLLLRLAPAAVIRGKVLDEVGEPVRHAMVTAYYDDHRSGVSQVRQFRSAQTDDQGSYEITPLIPGTYFLSAQATPWYAIHPNSEPEGQAGTSASVDRSLDMAYPLTYYADATETDSATPIPIRGGDRVQVDLHLNPVPALRIVFHAPGDGGKNGFTFPQLQQPAFDGSTFVHGGGVRVMSPGVLEISGILAGKYDVRVGGRGSSLQMNGVDLSNDGQEIDTSSGEALTNVKVSVRVPGDATFPQRLAVGLRSGRRGLARGQTIDAKGEAELPQIAAGRYEVVVRSFGKPYSIAHMSAERAEVSGHTLTVTAGSSPLVSLTLVAGTTEVAGTVTRAGKAFAGAMVVLAPNHPELDPSLFRRDQSDQDGTFTLHGVVPGSYTILAIENGWDLDWSQPAALAAYLKHGRTINVGPEKGRPLDIPEPIEVQLK
jgi:hypothetical protein